MDFPNIESLFNAFASKFKEQQPTTDPTVKASWVASFGRSIANSGYSIVLLSKEILKQFNPMTATGAFLELWASYDFITRLKKSSSIGVLRVYGIDNTIVVSGSEFVGDTNAVIFSNTASSEIQAQDTDLPPISIDKIFRSGTTATALCSYEHGLSTGMWVNIAGSNQTEYNITSEITVISIIEFTYQISGTPISPSTGIESATLLTKIKSAAALGGVATIETEFNHQLVIDQYVLLRGMDIAGYNGTFLITEIISDTIFTFDITDPTSDATVVGSMNSIHANVNLISSETGVNTNLSAGSIIKYLGNDPDIFENGVTIEGMQGGAVDESDDALRARLLKSRSSQAGVFTNDQIELAAKLINGNTRIFIQNPDNGLVGDDTYILAGQVRVYFIRDNDPVNIIPIGSIIQETKRSILEYGKKPATVWTSDVLVLPPIQLRVDIKMDNVIPNTASMRTAIKNQFNAYFTDNALFGERLDNDLLRAVAKQTKDLNSGDPSNTFIKQFDWTDIYTASDIITVTDSLGIARFSYSSGITLSINDEIIISGFITNTTYNGTFAITYIGVGFFEISSIAYVSDEKTGEFAFQTESVAKNELPILGKLTINDNEV